MQLNPCNLSFKCDQGYLEAPFLGVYFEKYIRHFRLCHFTSILFLSAWTCVDLAFYADYAAYLLAIRFCFVIPVFLLGFLLTFSPCYTKWHQLISVIYVLIVGSSFNAMLSIASGVGIYPFVFGLSICYVFNYTHIRLRFIAASTAGWLLLGISISNLLISQNHLPHATLFTAIFYLMALNALGMIISYTMEKACRQEFFLTISLEKERDRQIELNTELKNSIEEIKQLRGILPICASCKKIRDSEGYWEQVEVYISEHTDAQFSHGICETCAEKLYPGIYKKK